MTKKKSFISLREILITFAIAIAIIIVGSIKDLDITTKLYNPESPAAFAIFFSVIGEYPAYLGLVYTGTLLVLMFKQLNKWYKWVCLALAVAFIGVGVYMGFHHAFNLTRFPNIAGSDKLVLIEILFVVITIISAAIIFLLTWRLAKNKSTRELFTVVFYVSMIILGELALMSVAKYIFSRPRPNYLYNNNQFVSGFKNWWEVNPFASLKGGDGLKSCPSGHSGSAMPLVFILPSVTLLTEGHKDDEKLQIILYYAGLIWALVVGLSRVYAGAHYTSDVGMGFLFCMIVGWICTIFLNRKFKERAILEQSEELALEKAE